MSKIMHWNRAYGRDQEGGWEADFVQLGCCLEHISCHPLSSSPLLTKNSCHAVIDSLLYNYEELTDKCHSSDRFSDEELLLNYIDTFGMNALCDINGDFSGALYNEETHTLTLFRDHMGIRPLFYYADDQMVAFSTDIRGL